MTNDALPPYDPAHWQTVESLQMAIDGLPDPIFVKDRYHRIVVGNRALCTLIGRPHAELMGMSDTELFPPDQAAHFMRIDEEVITTRKVNTVEEELTNADGETYTLWTRKYPMLDADGQVIGVSGIIIDISEVRKRQRAVDALEADIASKVELIDKQSVLLEQLGAPVIQVWHGILLLPLIGALDDRRASRVMETMLEAIGQYAAELIIVDITGVPVVDTSVASYLIRSVRAAQLLGCRTLLVGIRGEIAQTLVGLGVDFGNIVTRASLQSGLEYAFGELGLQLRQK